MRGSVTSDGVGIVGVVCSDGRTVVRTDGDGAFELEPGGPFVFVCVPTGYVADRWYLPSDVEPRFVLRPQAQPVPFSFAQITDLHVAVEGWVFGEPVAATPAVTSGLLAEIAERHSDLSFIVSTGDQTNNGTEEEFTAYVEAVATSRLRVVSIPGNHDHNSVDPGRAREEGERFGPGVLYTPYDRHLGPRWFSFDHAGVHFVAIDWTTHHLGSEAGVQEDWVRADLACVSPGTPVVFLTHDLMSSAFFAEVGAKPLASFSGHWHTSRVVEASGALHVNTSPATFGGLDYSGAHWRNVTWDGNALSVSTQRPRTAGRLAARDRTEWSVQLEGAANRAGPIVCGDLVLVASSSEDRPAGAVEAFDAATGERRWGVRLGSGVKAAPRVCGDRVAAAAVTGETVCLDARTGAELWRTEIDDPLQLWTYLRPATDGRLVFVGDTSRFVALDLADGSVVWSRNDLGTRGNITCHSHPVVVDDVLMVSFAAQVPDMWALDAATGATIWPLGVEGKSIYELDAQAMAAHLPRTPVSAFARDPDAPDVYVVRLNNSVERIRVADGTLLWSATVAGWFSPSAPVVDGEDVFVCGGRGRVWCLSRGDGSVRWETEVTTSSPLHMGPYRNTHGTLLGEAALTDEHVVLACGDGRVVTLARDDGHIVGERILGTPFAAAPALAGSMCFIAAVDGVLHALAM